MFTIRVYGLLLRKTGEPQVLVSDEIIRGRRITKFPGGGLEYGEGLKDCLVREIREEMAVEALELKHFYTTDHFQQSTFHKEPMQVISVYYFFEVKDQCDLQLIDAPFAYTKRDQREGFRWLSLISATGGEMSLPIDKHVLKMLREQAASS